jgi:hypothetical protein
MPATLPTPAAEARTIAAPAAVAYDPAPLELPSIPPRTARARPLPRHKRVHPPVHLMADIPATSAYCKLGDRPPEPVLCTFDDSGYHTATEAEVFSKAHKLLQARFRRGIPIAHYPELLKRFLQAKLGAQRCPLFLALFLDRHGGLIQVAELFRGTSSSVNLYPKEVARRAGMRSGASALCADGRVRQLRANRKRRQSGSVVARTLRHHGNAVRRLPRRRRNDFVSQDVEGC